jgi:dedicator of cytokinesis protein 3
LTADDSPVEVTKLQSMMSLLAEKPTHPADEHIPHHLLVEFPHAFGELDSPKTIAAHLFSKAQGGAITPISEVHAINLATSNGTSSEGNMRTLFVDIGSSDLGEGAGSGSKLYVAFKVIVNESLRTTNALGYHRDSSSDVTDRHGSLKGGRRSLMWGKQASNTPKSPELKQEELPTSPVKNWSRGLWPLPSCE